MTPLQGEGSRHAKPGLYQEDAATVPEIISVTVRPARFHATPAPGPTTVAAAEATPTATPRPALLTAEAH